MHYTLKQLTYVEAAARLGSIANAAAELAISNSSIAAAIDGFEETLGYEIFVRTPAKGIALTPRGSDAMLVIRRLLHRLRHFDAEMQSLDGTARGRLRIACYSTAAPAVLPPILRSMTEVMPEVAITVLEGTMKQVQEFIETGEADLALSYINDIAPGQVLEPLFCPPPYALVPATDPIAGSARTTLAELLTRPFIMLDLAGARETYAALFESEDLALNIVHTTRSSEILRALVASGFGVGLLNIRPFDYRAGESGYRVLPIEGVKASEVFGILRPGSARPPLIVQTFVENCIALRDAGGFDHLLVK
ncbi:LysR substrate-binding domain-containing protein [Defluviimonas salinarum]|uniref:LysR substrate-binding domain-containing protein n=1 Tax=Defluviimonas salinarum TaxID=2992147 RepID=A0ABT3J7I4_9RHOB|nr:LysR substrate-binding domain-containing protein [Defluviimonas salinarum]MCW3783648.1 LysR substrate-binding domain-containing protein [Defluviimonas salinarum]